MMLIQLVACYFVFIISLTRARLSDDIADSRIDGSCIKEQCFYQPESACPKADSICRCRQLPNCKSAAVCCNVNKFTLSEGLACANIIKNEGEMRALHIRNATFDVLNVTESTWRRLKVLRYITITDGRFDSVVGEFYRGTAVSCLNLSSNSIRNFENRSLVQLSNLSFLDISYNNLTYIPKFKKGGNITVDISNNRPMLCTNVAEALKQRELHFSNSNDTFCLSSKTFHWFNTTEFVPLSQVIGIHELRRDCRKNCSCEPQRLDFVPGKPPTFAVAVNCSGAHLTTLPTPLPPNTISLNISNNNITSLEPVNTDPSYQSLRELDANNNQITSILPLEGSKFINNVLALSLRNNRLKSLPTYIFSNSFDRNSQSHIVYLGENELRCDCNTARVFKVWLLTKQKYIKDYDEIYCDDNTKTRIVQLNPANWCQTKQDWSDYINYIITIEVFLIVGLLSKVFYDYWVFKTSGYLPWPASKMPKMPCDCLCE